MKFEKMWINAKLATFSELLDKSYGVISNGAIAIADGKIKLVETMDRLKCLDIKADEVIDVKGNLITPGLIDCHTHLIYAGDRSNEFEMRLSGATYEEILRAGGGIISTVNATRKTSFEELYKISLKRLKALMNEGVTTVEIKSGYGLTFEDEIKILNVAKKLEENLPITIKKTFLGAHTIPPEYRDNRSGYVDKICNEMIPEVAKRNIAEAVDVFCEKVAFNIEETEKIFQCAKAYNLDVKIHAEQLSNSGGCLLASKYKALSADHLEFADEYSAKALSDAGVVAVLLPGASYFLQCDRKPPVDLFRHYGVDMAISTDMNPGTSPFCSILLMINMACVLFKLTPHEALKGVTIAAAKALGLEDKVGSLEVNKDADFAIWDAKPAELAYQYGINPLMYIVKKGCIYQPKELK